MEQVREMVRKYIPADVDLVDSFLEGAPRNVGAASG